MCARPYGAVSVAIDRRVEDAVEPAVDRGGDLLPVGGDHVKVRATLELEVVGLRRRALVVLVLRLRQRRRDRVVLAGADDQQRRPIRRS